MCNPEARDACDLMSRIQEAAEILEADETPRSWQITDERKAAIKELSELLTAIGCPSCHYYIQKNYGENITVLRAMLTEAGQK